MSLEVAGILALLIAVFGFAIGHKSKGSTPKGVGGHDAIGNFSEKASQAGVDLATSLASSSDRRVKRVLDWYRKRTGADDNSGSTD